MTYLWAVLVGYVVGLLGLLSLKQQRGSSARDIHAEDRDAVVIGALVVPGAMLFSAPLLGGMLREVGGSAGPLSVMLGGPVLIGQLALGSVLMLVAAGFTFRQWRRAGRPTQFALGAAMAGVALVGGMTSASHLRFMGEDAGVAYLGALEEVAGEISDVSCAAGVVAIHLDEKAGIAHYRCPSDWMMLTYRMEPIIPWPHYRDGASSELYEALDRLMGGAVQVGQE